MTPRKLTDTQLVLLSAAAQRQDGAIELTVKPEPAGARKALITLLNDGLVEEVPAGGTLPVWRRDDDQGALALRITARGLSASGSRPVRQRTWRSLQVPPGETSIPRDANSQGLDETIRSRRSQGQQGRGLPRGERVQAILRHRDAPTETGQHHPRDHQSNGLAAAFGARVLRRRGAQEARPHARFGEDGQ